MKDIVVWKNNVFASIKKFLARNLNKKSLSHSEEKEKIFDLYSKLKQNKIKMRSLNKDELVKINVLLKQEIKMVDKKISKLQAELEE